MIAPSATLRADLTDTYEYLNWVVYGLAKALDQSRKP